MFLALLLKKARLVSISLICIFVVGCSRSDIHTLPAEISASAEDPTQPFTMSIVEEVNDGDRLHVSTVITAKDTWNVSNVLLHLKAMKNGESVGEAFYPLAQPQGGMAKDSVVLEKGEKRNIKISVDAKEFSDYQLDLVWGKEADHFFKALPKSATIQVLNVHFDKVIEAKMPSIAGEIVNSGKEALKSLTLGVNFAWVETGTELDLSQVIPENESLVEVNDIDIPPGDSKQFSIQVEHEMPNKLNGHWEPIVRVVEEQVVEKDGSSRTESKSAELKPSSEPVSNSTPKKDTRGRKRH